MPREEILRLIPDDAGFCLLVQDLREQFDRLIQSPFAARFAASAIGRGIRSAPEAKQLAEFDRTLREQLHLSWAELRDDVLGDAFALAYTPGPPGKPEAEQGLLLVSARNPDRLATLIDRINELQKQSGELTALEERDYLRLRYFHRKTKEGDEFYCLTGPFLMFSNSETRLQQSMALKRKFSGLKPNAQMRQLQALGIEKNLFSLWINPRAFDSAIEQQVRSAQGDDAGTTKTCAQVWSALDAVAVTMRLEDDAALAFSVQARPDALPPTVRRFLSEARRPAAVWSAFPENALFAFAARVPLTALAEPQSVVPPRRTMQQMFEIGVGTIFEREVLPELLRHIGPDFGVCIAPPDAGWMPSLTAAVQLRGAGASEAVQKRVLGGLDVAVRFAVLALNNQHSTRWKVRTETQDTVEVRVIDGDKSFPPGLQPSFAWKGGYLVIASSPEVIRKFQPPKELDSPHVSTEVPMMRLALAGWAGYLRSHRQSLVTFIAGAHDMNPAMVNQRLDRLLEGLDLFDAVEIRQQSESGRATLTARLRMAAPLRNEKPR